MVIEQVSVFVENKKGSLKDILGILADGGVDLRAISIADTSDFGILRMIVPEPDATLELFRSRGVTASKTQVTGCKLHDEPGALHKVLSTLCDADISVEYIYAFLTRSAGDAYVILRVEDNAAARDVLQRAGHSLISQDDILTL
ncbi:MAG: hypothetical protein LBH95_08140 [Oscillospiraceae bacterium]|jgi:hypothetical protein|nr:hypothetical protein [Oscillospiraceae bacterium]